MAMLKNIFFVWEMGDDLGHLVSLVSLARRLVVNGIRVKIAVKDVSLIPKIYNFSHDGIEFIQSPRPATSLAQPNRQNRSLAQILNNTGFQDFDTLNSLVSLWKTLYRLVEPDLVIFDYAPVALLAANYFDFKTIIYGSSFFIPVPGCETVDLMPWNPSAAPALRASERHSKNIVNRILSPIGRKVEYLSDLYVADAIIIKGIPLLDIYSSQRSHDSSYELDLTGLMDTQIIDWGDSTQPKVFGYLKWRYRLTRVILEALVKLNVNANLYISGIDDDSIAEFSGGNLTLWTQPVNDLAAAQTADIVISHGGLGLACKAISYGTPLVIYPTQLEQINTIYTLEKLRSARRIHERLDANGIVKVVEEALKSSALKERTSKLRDQINAEECLLDVFGVIDKIMSIVKIN